jgi:hypothetical protein
MSSSETKGEPARREEPKGGYEPISVVQLAMAWWAYCEGLIPKLGLRVYFACFELEIRRRLSGGKYQPSLDELRKLVGGQAAADTPGQGGLRAALRQLQTLGLLRSCSKSEMTFAQSPDELRHEDLSGLWAMLAELPGSGRKIPVPRRILRRLAGGLSKSRTAVVIAHLMRCLFYRKGEGINPVGCCKASWIARVFGITERSVYDARKYLIDELGWLIAQDNSQHILNRNGLWVTVNLAWGTGEQKADAAPSSGQGDGPLTHAAEQETTASTHSENGFSPPPAENEGQFSGPRENKNPLFEGSKNQKPASGGPAGVCIHDGGEDQTSHPSAPPTLRDIQPEDLKDTGRLLELHQEAVEREFISPSESDRMKFAAGAAHAQAVGAKPCKLFAWMVWGKRWEYITQADEDAARIRLKQHFHGIRREQPVPAPQAASAPLSADALLARSVRAALQRAGYRGDPFPLLRREKPEWTRERWDQAVAELEQASRRPLAAKPLAHSLGDLCRLGVGVSATKLPSD